MRSQTSSTAPIALVVFLLLLAAGGGLLIAKTDPGLSLGVVFLLVVLFASFLNTELACTSSSFPCYFLLRSSSGALEASPSESRW